MIITASWISFFCRWLPRSRSTWPRTSFHQKDLSELSLSCCNWHCWCSHHLLRSRSFLPQQTPPILTDWVSFMDQKGDQKYENGFCTQASLAGWTNCWHANEVQRTLFAETSFKLVCRQFWPDSSALIYKQRRLRVNKTMCHHTLPHQSHHTINCHTTQCDTTPHTSHNVCQPDNVPDLDIAFNTSPTQWSSSPPASSLQSSSSSFSTTLCHHGLCRDHLHQSRQNQNDAISMLRSYQGIKQLDISNIVITIVNRAPNINVRIKMMLRTQHWGLADWAECT